MLCCTTLFFLVGGCSNTRLFNSYREAAQSFAAEQGFEKKIYLAGGFQLTSFQRSLAQSNELTIYIEGDGAPWRMRSFPPLDPTPQRLVVLGMAAQDPRDGVIYLGRPCQYLEAKALLECSPDYWMDSRYSEAVLDSMDQAIEQVMREHGATQLNLVGYSGGGTIALHLTERRADVVRLITVASPLDHQAWAEYHGFSPLSGSAAKIQVWRKVDKIPQFHFAGEKDTVMPPALLKRMLPPNATIHVVEGFDHECCWAGDWRARLAETGMPLTATR